MNRELIASPLRDLRRRGRGVNRETIATPLRDLGRWARANPDLALLSGLLVLTACFFDKSEKAPAWTYFALLRQDSSLQHRARSAQPTRR